VLKIIASKLSANLFDFRLFGTVTAPIGFWGLAYAGSNGICALDPGTGSATTVLDKIAPDGNSLSLVGPVPTYAASGNIAFGPDGALYMDAFTSAGALQLYRLNPVSGAVTAVGTGLQTINGDALTLVTAGGRLYGIDTYQASGPAPIPIYTIDTTTGQATDTGVRVTGLTFSYTLDTAAAAVPEPSTLMLLTTSSIAIRLGIQWSRRRKLYVVPLPTKK
jgi:PEP-CTERM motif